MTVLKIEPMPSGFGARLFVPVDNLLDEGVPAEIKAALNRYGVLVFPALHLGDEKFAELTAALGRTHALGPTDDKSDVSRKGIYRISLDKDDKTQLDYIKGNDYWHMDGTVYETPTKATLLKCEVPPSEGGETDFADLFSAYGALSDDKRRKLEGVRVIHCLAAVGKLMYDAPTAEDFARWNAVFPPTEHPLVWHQKDGRSSLVIGSTAGDIVGLEHEHGAAVLSELLEWCTSDRFTYRHHWQEGDLVIFNNPGLLHRSRPYTAASGRVMHRTTLQGEEAIA